MQSSEYYIYWRRSENFYGLCIKQLSAYTNIFNTQKTSSTVI